MARVTIVIPPEVLPDCKVVIARVDRDGCEADHGNGVFYGTHAECCEFMRTHRVTKRRRDPNDYRFAIIYTKNGHYASYVL